jgi:uncharacterized protein (TIGR03437 family)
VENADYSINSPSNPAHVGDFVTVYLTGSGAVSPAVIAGLPAPSTALSRVNVPNSGSIGGTATSVYFLGITPGFEGFTRPTFKYRPWRRATMRLWQPLAGWRAMDR